MVEIEKKRFQYVDLSSVQIKISLDDWKKMTADRSINRFGSYYYSEILLPKLKVLYNCYVPCIANHYLRKPEKETKLHNVSEKYYEVYVNIYGRHAHCCNCEVFGKISFYSYEHCVKGIVSLSGNRSHYVACVKSKPIKGILKRKLIEELQHQTPNLMYRKLQNSLNDQERLCGAHTCAPSQSVLRNLKYKGAACTRYSDNWVVNVEVFAKILKENIETFIRDIFHRPRGIILYSDKQIKAYNLICKNDIVYFDSTESVLKRIENYKDFQIYTLLVRNPFKGGPGLPVATSISTRHNAGSIRRFLELFLLDAVKVCGFNHKLIIVMIDGSMAIWNVVLRAFTNETRVEYYHRCWRIVTSKPCAGNMKKTFV